MDAVSRRHETMTAEVFGDGTRVPIDGGEDVQIFPGMPWPSAYRGSKYSLLNAKGGDLDHVLQWQYKDLRAQVEPPDGLVDALQAVGKSGGAGTGSIRITAGREVLTKVHTSEYTETEETPISNGWVPVYVGRLYGELPFEQIDINPELRAPEDVAVWDGFTFNHGETWSMTYDGQLEWRWSDYQFQSAFDHDELASKYQEFRPNGGRLYINEHGHVFGNVPQHELTGSRLEDVTRAFEEWDRETTDRGAKARRRLVVKRLAATGDGDPSQGYLPLYLGNLEQFDSEVIPQPVVDDSTYYRRAGERESEDE